MIANKRQLADIFGVTERTVTDWESLGMPVESKPGRGIPNQYDTSRCIEWRCQRVLGGAGQQRETARERRDRLEGDRLQVQLAREAGQFLVADEVREALVSAITTARSHFMRGPRQLKKRIDREYGIDLDLEILLEHARETLAALAANVPTFDHAGRDSDDQADEPVDY